MKILLLVPYFYLVNSLNILIYSPAFATSHMNFMAHISDTLTDAGHNVTVLVPITDAKLKPRIGLEKTNDIIIVDHDDEMREALGIAPDAETALKLLWERVEKPEDMENNLKWIFDQILATCPLLLRNEAVMKEIGNRKFDVAIAESLSVCGLGLFKKLGIEKTILAASCAIFDFQHDFIGEPNHVSYVPTSNCPHGDKMSIIQRYMNHKSSDAAQRTIINHFNREIKHFEKFGISDWRELFPSASAYFINSNPYIDYPRPIIQKTVAIGGISVHLDEIQSQKLSEDWQNILELRKRNFLISFGSIARSVDMPIKWRDNILNVIRTFPDVTFIWKYESDDLEWAEGVENVKFVKWTSQTALLKTKTKCLHDWFLLYNNFFVTVKVAKNYCSTETFLACIHGKRGKSNVNFLS